VDRFPNLGNQLLRFGKAFPEVGKRHPDIAKPSCHIRKSRRNIMNSSTIHGNCPVISGSAAPTPVSSPSSGQNHGQNPCYHPANTQLAGINNGFYIISN
jgi:hypothetical protein